MFSRFGAKRGFRSGDHFDVLQEDKRCIFCWDLLTVLNIACEGFDVFQPLFTRHQINQKYKFVPSIFRPKRIDFAIDEVELDRTEISFSNFCAGHVTRTPSEKYYILLETLSVSCDFVQAGTGWICPPALSPHFRFILSSLSSDESWTINDQTRGYFPTNNFKAPMNFNASPWDPSRPALRLLSAGVLEHSSRWFSPGTRLFYRHGQWLVSTIS